MADNEEQLQIEGDEKKGTNQRLIIIAAAFLLIGVCAIGGYFLFGGEKEGSSVAGKKIKTIYYKLEKPFVVNLQSSGRQRHMQVEVAIKGKDPEAMAAIEKHEPVIKNDLNQLFGSQEMQVLQTEQGLQKLNTDATKVVQAFLQKEIGAPGIEQVLFENFVMQ